MSRSLSHKHWTQLREPVSGYGEAFVCDFIKEITIRGKIDEGNYLGEATKVEVADLNLIIDRLRNAYRFEKRILNRELAGSWGIISYLFQNRTGLFLYGIFSQLITGSTGNVSSEIKQEQFDQSADFRSSKWLSDKPFLKTLEVLFRRTKQDELVRVSKIFNIVCPQKSNELQYKFNEDYQNFILKRNMQWKQRENNLRKASMLNMFGDQLFRDKQIFTEPDQLYIDLLQQFPEDQYVHLDDRRSLGVELLNRKIQSNSELEEEETLTIPRLKLSGNKRAGRRCVNESLSTPKKKKRTNCKRKDYLNTMLNARKKVEQTYNKFIEARGNKKRKKEQCDKIQKIQRDYFNTEEDAEDETQMVTRQRLGRHNFNQRKVRQNPPFQQEKVYQHPKKRLKLKRSDIVTFKETNNIQQAMQSSDQSSEEIPKFITGEAVDKRDLKRGHLSTEYGYLLKRQNKAERLRQTTLDENINNFLIRQIKVECSRNLPSKFNTQMYLSYLRSLYNDKQVFKEIKIVAKELLSRAQLIADQIIVNKLLLMHLIGEDTAFTYSFLWRKYDKDYILHCLAQCIAHNVGIGLAEVMNNLFTSKHNQNISQVEKVVGYFKDIFNLVCESKLFSLINPKKTLQRVIEYLGKAMLNLLQQQNNSAGNRCVVLQNCQTGFHKHFRIFLSTQDKFICIFIASLIFMELVLDNSSNILTIKEQSVEELFQKIVCNSQLCNSPKIFVLAERLRQFLDTCPITVTDRIFKSLLSFTNLAAVYLAFCTQSSISSDQFAAQQILHVELMRLTLKHFLTNELKLPCINPLALLNKLLVQSPLKNLKDYPKDNNSIQVLSYLEVLGCLIDFVIFQAESFFKHCLNYLSNIAIPHIYCHYHQSTLSAVVLLAAKVCDLSAAKDVAQQNDNFIIDFDEKNLIILQIRKLIVNIFEIIVKKYKLVQKHSEIPYSQYEKELLNKLQSHEATLKTFFKMIMSDNPWGDLSVSKNEMTNNQTIQAIQLLKSFSRACSISHYYFVLEFICKQALFMKWIGPIDRNCLAKSTPGHLGKQLRLLLLHIVRTTLEKIKQLHHFLFMNQLTALTYNAYAESDIETKQQYEYEVMNIQKRQNQKKALLMHHYITIVKKYFLEDISCDNFLQNNLCEGLQTNILSFAIVPYTHCLGLLAGKKQHIQKAFRLIEETCLCYHRPLSPIDSQTNVCLISLWYLNNTLTLFQIYLQMFPYSQAIEVILQQLFLQRTCRTIMHLILLGHIVGPSEALLATEACRILQFSVPIRRFVESLRPEGDNDGHVDLLKLIVAMGKQISAGFDELLNILLINSRRNCSVGNTISPLSRRTGNIFIDLSAYLKSSPRNSFKAIAILKILCFLLQWFELLPTVIKIYYIDLQVSSTTDGVIDRVTTDVIGLRVIFFLLRAVDSCANDLHHMRSDLANRYASNLCRKWVAADKNTHNRVYLLSWRDFMTNCEAVLSTNPELLWAVQKFVKILVNNMILLVTKYSFQNLSMKDEIGAETKLRIFITYLKIMETSSQLRSTLQNCFLSQAQMFQDFLVTRQINNQSICSPYLQKYTNFESLILNCMIGLHSKPDMIKTALQTRMSRLQYLKRPQLAQTFCKILQKCMNYMKKTAGSDTLEWFKERHQVMLAISASLGQTSFANQ